MWRLPAEWEPQSGILITWPHKATDWSSQLEEIEQVYREIAREITRFERLLIVCQDSKQKDRIAVQLSELGIDELKYRPVIALSNDTWIRDYGPLTVLNKNTPQLLDFRFNAWGEQYAYYLDDRITEELVAQNAFQGSNYCRINRVLEGGAIETDGQGTLLATTSSLISAKRNPGVNQATMEAELRFYLGIERFLWIVISPLTGDDTDAHIDTLARFCGPESICYIEASQRAGTDSLALQALHEQLQQFSTPQGDPYKLIPLPQVPPIYGSTGRRLPATYANFLILNQAILVPFYRVPEDELALTRLASCFPDREIIPIDCRSLIEQNGSLHCATMQIPAQLVLLSQQQC